MREILTPKNAVLVKIDYRNLWISTKRTRANDSKFSAVLAEAWWYVVQVMLTGNWQSPFRDPMVLVKDKNWQTYVGKSESSEERLINGNSWTKDSGKVLDRLQLLDCAPMALLEKPEFPTWVARILIE